MSTLLEKAVCASSGKCRPLRDDFDFTEKFDLAMAYATRQINGKQVYAAIGGGKKNLPSHFYPILAEAIRRGILVRKDAQ